MHTEMIKRWNDKRFYSLDYYLKKTFGKKIYKISLNGSTTCPNRDGTLDTRGCIFCSEGGSGEYAQNASVSISEQIEAGKLLIASKYSGSQYIAYFQAFTGTYAPIEYLEKIFYEAITNPAVAVLSIATRPDCLDDKIINLLDKLNKNKPVWIELGLQTIHQKTADFIRRGYDLNCFKNAVNNLNNINVNIIVHVIIGLPNETPEHNIETINYLANTKIHGIKIQLMHILKRTDLADLYYSNSIKVLSLDEYTDIVVKCIERLPDNIVIHRMTGDGSKDLLIAPLWSRNKKLVLNTINHKFKMDDTWQGKYYNS